MNIQVQCPCRVCERHFHKQAPKDAASLSSVQAWQGRELSEAPGANRLWESGCIRRSTRSHRRAVLAHSRRSAGRRRGTASSLGGLGALGSRAAGGGGRGCPCV